MYIKLVRISSVGDNRQEIEERINADLQRAIKNEGKEPVACCFLVKTIEANPVGGPPLDWQNIALVFSGE